MKYAIPSLLVLFLLSAFPCHAGSIWARRGPGAVGLYADDTARRVGDLLTVIISERTKIQNDESREFEKESAKSATWSGAYGEKKFNPLELELSADNDFEGSAAFDSDRSVSDRVTVMVVDILPNGNLVVTGRRTRSTEGDLQIIRISGIVRPSDVTFENTVLSEQISDFQVIYEGKGPHQSFSNPGFLDRFVNFIWPW